MEASTLQKSMDTTMSKFTKDSEDEQTVTKRKRNMVDWFVYLPDEILADILKRFPDVFLRYKAKYVCKRWLNVITNRILLDHASFILQKFEHSPARLLDIREEGQLGLQAKVQYLDIPQNGTIRSWCNEFLLISDSNRKGYLLVYNLITKEGLYVPYCASSCYAHTKCGVALSFDSFKGIYKVVHLCMDWKIECHILTLGKEFTTSASLKFQKINAPDYVNEGQNSSRDPVSFQGRYYNWIINHSKALVSVDMVKQEVHVKSLPGSGDRYGHYVCDLFVMNGLLAFFDGVSQDKAQIWVLKDFHGVKWDKLQLITNIDKYFDRYLGMLDTYRVYGMISKRYIILKSTMYGMFSYDLESGVMEKLAIHIGVDVSCVAHSSALS